MQRLWQKKAFPAEHMSTVYSTSAVLDPLEWFAMYGENMKQLSDAAMRILSIPPTASGGERDWSAFKHIWSDHRTKLLVGKVGMLVYIYFNSR